jgi:hypothetical protein
MIITKGARQRFQCGLRFGNGVRPEKAGTQAGTPETARRHLRAAAQVPDPTKRVFTGRFSPHYADCL